MHDSDSLRKLVNNNNKNKVWSAVDIVKNNSNIAPVLSKLIEAREKSIFDVRKKDSFFSLDQSQLHNIVEVNKSRMDDAENILQLFPDIELCIQIIVSSVLSPKDMVQANLLYKNSELILPEDITASLNQIVKSHIEGYYKLKEELPTILREVLFSKGSYVSIVLPESVVDELINTNNNRYLSTESYTRGIDSILVRDNKKSKYKGILGSPFMDKDKTISLEGLIKYKPSNSYNGSLSLEETVDNKPSIVNIFQDCFEITDNFELLKLPEIITETNKSKLNQIFNPEKQPSDINISFENNDVKKMSFDTIHQMMFKNTSSSNQTFIKINTPDNAKRKSIGRPLRLKLPSESVINIYKPGEESKSIAHFVLIDIDGNPVTSRSSRQYLEGLTSLNSSLNSGNNTNSNMPSQLIDRARKNLVSTDSKMPTIDQIALVYTNIVETDLIERLRNSVYGRNVEIGNNEEIYRIMLARSLANQYTRLLFIPGDLCTYYAFKYFNNGIGKSYLDDIKLLTSIRAAMLFAKVMGLVKNAISVTHVDMTLSPEDQDPRKTIEIATHEVLKLRQLGFPLGINSPTDLVEWINRAGVEFTFKGHPGLPDTSFDFSTRRLDHVVPDTELEKDLSDKTYQTFGLSPETVSAGINNPEFATTVVANNILLSKRIIVLSQLFSNFITKDCQKIIRFDNIIRKELEDSIRQNIGKLESTLNEEEKVEFKKNENSFIEECVDRYIECLTIELPKPDSTTIKNLKEEYTTYKEAIEQGMEAWISSEIITNDTMGDLSEHIGTLKSMLTASLLRKFQTENNYLPELSEMVTKTDDDNDDKITLTETFNNTKNFSVTMSQLAIKLFDEFNKYREAADKDMKALDLPDPNGSSGFDSGSDSSSSDEFGSDSFNFDETTTDLDTTTTDTETTDTTEENTEETGDKENEELEATDNINPSPDNTGV